MFGVYNQKTKKFILNICEPSKKKARKKMFEKLGKDAYKWRYVIKKIADGQL